MASLNVPVEELSCPVCREIFKVPVILSCSHSFCEECLQQFWRTKGTQECPVCRRRSSKENPPCNLALKNLCEEFVKQSSSEEMCALHQEKLKLFCLDDEQPVCVVCRDSQRHINHTFRPIREAASSSKEQLDSALKNLLKKLQDKENIKGEFERKLQNIKAQAEHTESQIRLQFQKLHQFLRDEEEASVAALRKEEEQKQQVMKEKLEESNKHISALSNAIKATEKTMNTSDVHFLKEFPFSMKRVQISQPDLQMPAGALIYVAPYLDNLMLRVSKKMQDMSERRIVLLGERGVGKSAAGNTILGQKEFRSISCLSDLFRFALFSVTRGCSEAHTTVSDRSVSVVDTPGLFHIQRNQDELMMDISCFSNPGPHAFLIVLRADGRVTEEEQQIPQMMEKMFGQEVLKYSIILFTCEDLLERETLEELIEENRRLRALVQQCGGRYHLFNNTDEENREQVNDLLRKIDSMVQQNGGGHYSNQMIRDALKAMQRGRKQKN